MWREAAKLGTPEAEEIMKSNVAYYDKARQIMQRRCKAPDCDYVIGTMPSGTFEVPGLGEVCDLCHDVYKSLTGPHLKNVMYFRNLHAEWVKENDPAEIQRRKDRLGF
jgi:hypothetical protein